MNLQTLTIRDIKLDVYYNLDITPDAYCTGDSPADWELEIIEVSAQDSVVNLIDLLSDALMIEIESGIIEIERNNRE